MTRLKKASQLTVQSLAVVTRENSTKATLLALGLYLIPGPPL